MRYYVVLMKNYNYYYFYILEEKYVSKLTFSFNGLDSG